MANLDGLLTANAKERKGHPFLELDSYVLGMFVVPGSFKLCLALHTASKRMTNDGRRQSLHQFSPGLAPG